MNGEGIDPDAPSAAATSEANEVHVVVGQGLPGAQAFGDLLRRRRLELNRRVDDVASAVEVTPSYLRMIESGKRAPAPDKAARLLKALDVPTRTDDRADLIVDDADGRRWIVEFKHWATPAATFGLALGAIVGGPLGAVAGAATGSSLSRLLSRSPKATGVDDVTDAELIGRIVQRASVMRGDELRDLWAALNAITEAHQLRRQADDDIIDAEVVGEPEEHR